MSGRLRKLFASSLVAAGVLFGAPVFAQPEPLPGDRAVALAQEGLKQYEAGAWAAAFDKFQQADAASHSPVFRLYMARAKRNLQKLIEARTIYRELVGEKLPDGALASWRQAQADGRAELNALESSIPTVVLDATGATAAATVQLDGRPVALGKPIELDPGDHEAVLTDGERTVKEAITVRSGERDRRVMITLSSSDDGDDVPPPPPPGADAPSEGSVVPGVILLSIGGAGLIAGAICGGLALSIDGDIVEHCAGGTCDDGRTAQELKDDQDLSLALAHASTGTLIGGGVLAAVGVVLVIVRPGGDEAAPAVSIGPGRVGATWTF